MTHIRLDDGFGEHQKISCLTDTAYRLYVNGLCYCSRRQTDGFIPALAAPLLMGRSIRALMGPVAELTKFDLWEPLETGGWYVHDYLKHQRSKAQIEQQKTAGKRRLERWRNGVTDANETPSVTPRETTPEGRGQRAEGRVGANAPPDQETSVPAAAAVARTRGKPPAAAAASVTVRDEDRQRAIDAFNEQSPGGILPPIVQWLNEQLDDGVSVEWLEAACREAALNGGRKPPKYLETIIGRWKRDGFQASRKGEQHGRTGQRADEFVSAFADEARANSEA